MIGHRGRGARIPLVVVLALLLAGCATLPRTNFGLDEQRQAQPIGFSDVRFDADSASQSRAFDQRFQSSLSDTAGGGLRVLALSGGGAQGAYGAGLLVGWTAAGTRPRFAVVTGVSTGALIAPFAFLGPKWDDHLHAAFTDGRITALLRRRGLEALFSVGLYHPEPLRGLVESYVDDALLTAVARENAKGRRLLVATTNLDTQRSVIWDMGAIAARGGPLARTMFVNVLVASASVPGVFPPVLIPVEDSHGRRFEEMHADGGTIAAFFAVPESLLLSKLTPPGGKRTEIFVILNNRIEPSFSVTRRNTLAIAARAFDTMQKATTRTSVSVTEAFCLRNTLTRRFADVPDGARSKGFLDFSKTAMAELYELGRSAGQSGAAWRLADSH
jgi:hypothetical protein